MYVFNIVALLLVPVAAAVSSSASRFGLSRTRAAEKAVFGISRGGGLFSGEKKDDSAAEVLPKYPALNKEEVEEWLGHIPVFAVTDSSGAGVVLKPDNETSVFYFFMSPQMANATLQQLKSTNENLDLRVSAFSLGKIWFKILKAGKDTQVQLKAPGSDGEGTATTGVEYRLVPDTRDLLGARMLLTMDPEDGKALQEGGSMTAEMAQNAMQKAMTQSPKFNATFNEVPVFMIQQMRMQKQTPEGQPDETDPTTILPMYFNLQNMVNIWQKFASQSPDASGVEPAINLMDLFELVERMQEESEIDFRNVLLVPSSAGTSAPGMDMNSQAAAAAAQGASGATDPFGSAASGPTLGDL